MTMAEIIEQIRNAPPSNAQEIKLDMKIDKSLPSLVNHPLIIKRAEEMREIISKLEGYEPCD